MSDFDCDPLFSRLYLEMLEQMTAYSARRLGDIGLAEDVAQDTFAECWKNWEQGQRVKHYPNPRGWLWEALKIKLKKMREDMEKVRTVPLDELAHPPAAPVERRLYLSDYLPPDTSRADRRIVRLRLEGYRYQEIAEKMGMTEIQCRVRLFRLREKLKNLKKLWGTCNEMKFFKDIKSKEVSRCRKSESPRRTGHCRLGRRLLRRRGPAFLAGALLQEPLEGCLRVQFQAQGLLLLQDVQIEADQLRVTALIRHLLHPRVQFLQDLAGR